MKMDPRSLENMFTEILDLSEQMLQVVKNSKENEDWAGEISQILEKRQGLMGQVDEYRAKVNLSATDEQKIKGLIKKIQINDGNITQSLQEEMLRLQERIGNVKQNKIAQDAYLINDNQMDGWFFDSKK
ncbi:MAG TPA: flagellar protein FliT [Syntrophomonadaceae bacterium]|nr:flagellar protein FliT [Syntrophomonadaceae bacterium]